MRPVADRVSPVPRQPDIVLILTDQQRHDQVGYASDGHFETPNLDGLAARGTVFDHAYSAATVCVPSRVSLLTGLAAHRVPVEPGTDLHLRQGTATVARTLRAAGYQTALVGKMHFWPMNGDYGFDIMRTCEHLFPADFVDGVPAKPEGVDDYHRWLLDQGVPDWRATPPAPATPGSPPHLGSPTTPRCTPPAGWPAKPWRCSSAATRTGRCCWWSRSHTPTSRTTRPSPTSRCTTRPTRSCPTTGSR